MSFDNFFDSYLETAVWSSHDWSDMDNDNPEPLDKNYSTSDIAKSTRNYLKRDAKAFYDANKDLWSDRDDGRAGHDFWLTRNGHGAGFWDGDYERGDELTAASKPFGEEDLYVYRGKIRSSHEPKKSRTRSTR
ncbi:MAG: hypothetical protein ACYDH4_11310 [Candidatus Cryosericum sp.]